MMRLPFIAALAAAALLAGCAVPKNTSVTIAEVQAESNAITAALSAGAKIYVSAASTTPAEATAVQNMLNIAEGANAALQGKIDATSVVTLTQTATNDLSALIAVLPVDPATKVAIDAGMAVLDTFIAEQMGEPVVAPALGVTQRGARVPIPAPKRLP